MILQCNGTSIGLDEGKGEVSFVSHAHADHLNGVKSKEEILSSEETIELGGLKGKIKSLENVKLLEAGHEISVVITAKSAPEYAKREKDFKALAEKIKAPFFFILNIIYCL